MCRIKMFFSYYIYHFIKTFGESSNITSTCSVSVVLNSSPLKSGFKGKSYEITDKNLFKFICKMPFNTFLTVPRILYQAGKMHFLQKIPFAKKHVNKHKNTYESSYPPYIRIL